MIQTNIPNLTNKEIMQKIEQEAKREKPKGAREIKNTHKKPMQQAKVQSVSIYDFAVKIGKFLQKNGFGNFAKRVQKTLKLYPQNRIYIMHDFIKFYDEEFVNNTYNLLFFRDPTDKEKEYYLFVLRSGKVSKTEIVLSLYYSKEAREQNIIILGVKKRYLLMLLYKIPFVGYLAKTTYTLLTLPKLLERIASHENLFYSKIQYQEMKQSNFEAQLQTKASNDAISDLTSQLQTKASNEMLQNVQKELQTKASNDAISDLTSQLQTKASNEMLQNVQKELQKKANIKNFEFYRHAMTYAKHITAELQSKATLEDFKYYMQTLQQAREYMHSVQKNMQTIIAEANKRLTHEEFEPKELLAIAKEEKHMLDAFYVAFEERFRGSREEIKQKVQKYLSYIVELPFSKETMHLLDIGCGRGEWLELLKENGYSAKGIDLNHIMVEQSKRYALDVQEADVLAYLYAQPEASLSFISGFHIIEHLSFEVLMKLFAECNRVLQKGGMVLFETPNPENLVVGACTFYTDPTHKNPLVPDATKFLLEYNGFINAQILRVNGSFDVDLQNEFLNLQFNPQFDYAVIGYKA